MVKNVIYHSERSEKSLCFSGDSFSPHIVISTVADKAERRDPAVSVI
ncbi:MAG: hypothetical protein IJU84_07885 [Clostridia bacterium]|nr:hypothetical protein [Clostridia bacterium]